MTIPAGEVMLAGGDVALTGDAVVLINYDIFIICIKVYNKLIAMVKFLSHVIPWTGSGG